MPPSGRRVRLIRVRPLEDAGIRRVRSGSGFRYLRPDGSSVSRRARERIRTLVIPPAWTDVWIATNPAAHIQAVGVDAAGRRQYLYHPSWRERRDRNKFEKALALAEALPRARAQVTRALREEGLDRARVLAVAFRLLDSGAPRVGSTRYFERHGSRGLTTLQRRDAAVSGSIVTLSFPAKSGQRALIEIDDAELAPAIDELARGRPSAPLLSYRHGRRRVGLRPGEVNAYVARLTGGPFTAKDFRTLRGTIVAADTLARAGVAETTRARGAAERDAVAATAAVLGNTPTIARNSYIDPRVFEEYGRGRLLDTGVAPETAIRRLLSSSGS
jgi:DNA topoisomerase IB